MEIYVIHIYPLKARDTRRITKAEIKYIRKIAGHTWTDHKTNTGIANELKRTQFLDKIEEYRRKWLQLINGTPSNRLPRIVKNCRPTGRRNQGRPLKRLLDLWDQKGSTSGPTHFSWKMMMMMMMILCTPIYQIMEPTGSTNLFLPDL